MPVCLECLSVVGKTRDREGGMVRDGTKWTCRLITLRVDRQWSLSVGCHLAPWYPIKHLSQTCLLFTLCTHTSRAKGLWTIAIAHVFPFSFTNVSWIFHIPSFFIFFSCPLLHFALIKGIVERPGGRGDWSRANGWMWVCVSVHAFQLTCSHFHLFLSEILLLFTSKHQLQVMFT